jgi:hypothetical protein
MLQDISHASAGELAANPFAQRSELLSGCGINASDRSIGPKA